MSRVFDIARHMGVSVDEVLELEGTYPKLFDFFEKEKRKLEEDLEEAQEEKEGLYDSGYDDGYSVGRNEAFDEGYACGLEDELVS